ncbi:YozE family protein [Caballeronia jiangsuensis]|uniref:YozE family protein n=1 Tax=Caballeronia jiangsuensis TaxID=1458357 RepID=A0ABW9CST4_9BURK
MSNPLSAPQLEQLRRNAKRLARREAIPLNEAQDRLAQQHGFSNWALLKKHTPNREPILPQPSVQADSRVRYYFHGDQKEEDANLYYCVHCDLSFLLGHFAAEHGPTTVERYIRQLETADARPTGWHRTHRRPANAVNALDEEVRRFRAEAALREASRSAFHRWLVAQADRGDQVGDIAHDIKRDTGFPVAETRFDELIAYLESKTGHHVILSAFRRAHVEFALLNQTRS